MKKLFIIFILGLIFFSCKKSTTDTVQKNWKVLIIDDVGTYTDSTHGKYYITYKDTIINGKKAFHFVSLDGVGYNDGTLSFYLEFTAISDSNNNNYKIDTSFYKYFAEYFYSPTGYLITQGSAIVNADTMTFSFIAVNTGISTNPQKEIFGYLIMK